MDTCYGCCDQCYQMFSLNENVYSVKSLIGKFLQLDFCNEKCVSQAKDKYYWLNDKNFVKRKCDYEIKRNLDNLANLIEKFPQFVIVNYRDFYNSQVNNIDPLNVQITLKRTIKIVELLEQIKNSENPTSSGEIFLSYCKQNNIY